MQVPACDRCNALISDKRLRWWWRSSETQEEGFGGHTKIPAFDTIGELMCTFCKIDSTFTHSECTGDECAPTCTRFCENGECPTEYHRTVISKTGIRKKWYLFQKGTVVLVVCATCLRKLREKNTKKFSTSEYRKRVKEARAAPAAKKRRETTHPSTREIDGPNRDLFWDIWDLPVRDSSLAVSMSTLSVTAPENSGIDVRVTKSINCDSVEMGALIDFLGDKSQIRSFLVTGIDQGRFLINRRTPCRKSRRKYNNRRDLFDTQLDFSVVDARVVDSCRVVEETHEEESYAEETYVEPSRADESFVESCLDETVSLDADFEQERERERYESSCVDTPDDYMDFGGLSQIEDLGEDDPLTQEEDDMDDDTVIADTTSGYTNDDTTSGYTNDVTSGYTNDVTSGYTNDVTSGYTNDVTSGYTNDTSAVSEPDALQLNLTLSMLYDMGMGDVMCECFGTDWVENLSPIWNMVFAGENKVIAADGTIFEFDPVAKSLSSTESTYRVCSDNTTWLEDVTLRARVFC